MAQRGIEVLVSTIPENVYYLSGFHTPGYYFPEFLIITQTHDPMIVVREFEKRNVDAYCWFGIENRRSYQDYEGPATAVADVLKGLGADKAHVALEFNSWFLTLRLDAAIRAALPNVKFQDGSGLVEECRKRKSKAELDYVRRACAISSAAMTAAQKFLPRCDITENDLAGEVHRAMVSQGGEYTGLPVFLSSGWRSQIPHAIWSDKKIGEGENILLELTGVVKRYAGPLFRTFFVGDPPQALLDRAKTVRDMQDAIIETLRPGVTSHEVNAAALRASGQAATGVTKRAGYSVGINFPPDWGEGVFLDLKTNDQTVMEPGMVFHTPQSIRLPGRMPVALSETLLVTESGCEVLTAFERELIVV